MRNSCVMFDKIIFMREGLKYLVAAWDGGKPGFFLQARAMAFALRHFSGSQIMAAKNMVENKDWDGLRSLIMDEAKQFFSEDQIAKANELQQKNDLKGLRAYALNIL